MFSIRLLLPVIILFSFGLNNLGLAQTTLYGYVSTGRPPLAFQDPTPTPTSTTTTTCSCTSTDGRCPMTCNYSNPPDMDASCIDKCVRLANEMCANQTMPQSGP